MPENYRNFFVGMDPDYDLIKAIHETQKFRLSLIELGLLPKQSKDEPNEALDGPQEV